MNQLTEDEMKALLRRVGLNPMPAGALAATFAELSLDSLARIEIATRIQESHGVNLEHLLATGTELTPGGVMAMVNDELAAVAG